jgi:hypothetical protein
MRDSNRWFRLVWPEVCRMISANRAVLLNEGAETLALARNTGFRRFTDMEGFKTYLREGCSG